MSFAGGGTADTVSSSTTGSAIACDPDEAADDGTGYFVSRDGSDEAGAGTRANPFASIAFAIDRAQATGRGNVYLAPGTYEETLTLSDSDPGIVISGGWSVNEGTQPAAVDARLRSGDARSDTHRVGRAGRVRSH